MKNIISSLLVFGLAFGSAYAQTEAQSLPESDLTIASGDETLSLTIELADEPEELATGLMFRDGIADDRGMLFDFGDPREVNMYMRNVSFGLDMLFLDETGEVMAIAQYVQPESERLINPGMPVKGVLEIGAGRAKALGIEPGDVVEHPMFTAEADPIELDGLSGDEADSSEAE